MVKLPSLNLARLQIISVRQNGNVEYLTRPIHQSVELYVIRSLPNSNHLKTPATRRTPMAQNRSKSAFLQARIHPR
jgi:hypothetical protein